MGKQPASSCLLRIPSQQGSQALWRAVRHKVLHVLVSGGLPICLNINQQDRMLLPAAVTWGTTPVSSLSGRHNSTQQTESLVTGSAQLPLLPWPMQPPVARQNHCLLSTVPKPTNWPKQCQLISLTKSLTGLDGTTIVASSPSQLFYHFTTRFIHVSIHLLGVGRKLHSLVTYKG